MARSNSWFATLAIFYLAICCVLPSYQLAHSESDDLQNGIDSLEKQFQGLSDDFNKAIKEEVAKKPVADVPNSAKVDSKTTVKTEEQKTGKTTVKTEEHNTGNTEGKATVKTDGQKPSKTEGKSSDKNGVESIQKPEEKLPKDAEGVSIGDFTTARMWEFTQTAMNEMKSLDGTVLEKKSNLVTAAFPLLDKFIEPSKKLMEHNVCGPDLASKLDAFMKSEYEYVKNCGYLTKATDRFHTIVQDAINFLDDLTVGIVKEVSICEQLEGERAKDCFQDVYRLAEHKKYYFKSGEMVRLKQQAAESMDKLENYWMGCTLRAMSAVKKVNAMLEKKLKCCQRGVYNSGDCFDLKQTFAVTLQIKPDESDVELYYIEIKHQNSGL